MGEPIILANTKEMGEEEWQAARQHGPDGNIPYTLGGSDIATIFGVSPFCTAPELWLYKSGRKPFPKKTNEAQLLMGHQMEPIIRYWYSVKTQNQVFLDYNLYQHCDFPYLLANIDGRYIIPQTSEDGILECKSTSYYKADVWGEDKYPVYYELQLRDYLGICNRRVGQFAAMWGMNPDLHMATPEVTRDLVKESLIYEQAERFIWSLTHDKRPKMSETNVAAQVALESLARICREGDKSLPLLKLPPVYADAIKKMYNLQTQIKEHEGKISELKKKKEILSVDIIEFMDAYEKAVLETTDNKYLIDFVTKSKTSVDREKLKELNLDLHNQCLKRTTSRSLQIKTEAVS